MAMLKIHRIGLRNYKISVEKMTSPPPPPKSLLTSTYPPLINMSQADLDSMVALILLNVVDPFMSKVTQEEVQLCWGILVKEGDDPGTRENEDHLFTLDVQEAAKRLMDSVSCDDISLLTKAVFLIDCATSAPIRKQQRSKMWARNTFVHKNTGMVTDILPDSAAHSKHKKIGKAYATMVVLGRAILRVHGVFCDKGIAPLESEGHESTNYGREKLFREMGENCLGIPWFTENKMRTLLLELHG